MGTRAAFGFHVDGKDKLSYNQYDGYPTGLGIKVFKDCIILKQMGWDKLADKVRGIRMVNPEKKPTLNDVGSFSQYSDPTVNGGNGYYSLLRELQGELAEIVKAGIMTQDNNFIKDSLFCEWAYILNIDTKKLEIYAGFQQKKHNKGRYGKCRKTRDNYYACALIHEIDLDCGADILHTILTEETFWNMLEQSGEE